MKKPVILCVDDESIVLKGLEAQLSRQFSNDYVIELAESGEEALEIIEELREQNIKIPLIISDQLMPGLKGNELLSEVHKISPSTLKILLTGQADASAVGDAVNRAKLYRYISKPWEQSDLLLTVNQALLSFSKDVQLEEQNRLLKEYNEHLEKKVEVRTAEIAAALSELQQTQNKLVESEKMASLGTLVAGIAHEINTPVGIGIQGASTIQANTKDFAQNIKANTLNRTELIDYVEMVNKTSFLIFNNLKRVAELVKSFKKVSIDHMTEEKQSFNFKAYIKDVLTILAPNLKTKDIKIRLDIPDALEICSFPLAFAQILTNFVNNSLIHGFENQNKGEIFIKAETQDKQLVLNYSDTGRGMSQEVLNKIFDPFFTTNKQKGSGLGMHIVYNIVTQKLGGEISCNSESEKGVRFTIQIPV